ncbi:tetratricopeptide repeat-containing sensor histidine kinase [Salmonirosea aquatica]|uniref:Tetratricopeptide repeat protein n=1 Tax=Salmonirosea aquatica TaxID=2654236 RepID=A0A7C9BTD9_9BACT|nr:tetratricopeptide repeat protein [Cytophagaceae bacterium SJW1-29]
MVVLRSILIAIGLMVVSGRVAAQSSESKTNPPNFTYWENQPQSILRDTTLIRLYAQNANLSINPDSALLWLQKGFAIALRLRSNNWLAFTHNRMGLVYLRKGVSFQAIEYLFKGLQYAELAKKISEEAFSWDFIGDCYADLKDYEKSISAENHAIDLYRKSMNQMGMASSLNDLGAALSANQQLPASIAALERSLKLSRSLQNVGLQVNSYHTLAATLLKKGDFNQAEKYAQLAIDTETQSKGRANAELLALMGLIDAHRDRPDKSLNYAARAEFYLSYEWPLIRERTAYTLFEIYKALQKFDTALQWYEKYVELRDNNNLVAQEKRIEVLRYEYDAQQRDTRMQLMANDIARESYLRWILIAGIVIFLGLAAALLRSNLLLQKQREELDITNEQLVHVGQLLKQTNANLEDRVAARTNELREANRSLTRKNHEIQEALFRGQNLERKRVASELHNNLGSLLSGVKWRLESVDTEKFSVSEQDLHEGVLKLINDAYDQVRHISHNLLPSILEKEGLIPALQKLVADVNRPGKLAFDFIVSKDVRIEDKKVAFELYSCVLELITNILKHAEARQVVLEIAQTQGFHILMITDDGVGVSREQAGQSGQGILNIRQRVKSLNGNFSIRALKKSQGTAVTLRIPRQPLLVS